MVSLVAAGSVTTAGSPQQCLSHPCWVIALGTGSGGMSIPTLICCLHFDNSFKPSLPTGTNDGQSMMVPSCGCPQFGGNSPSEFCQGSYSNQSNQREGCHLTWDQTEVRGWHKSSGKLHPFLFSAGLHHLLTCRSLQGK